MDPTGIISINYQTIIQIINFIIIFVIAKKLLFDKVNAMLKARSDEIVKELNEAETLKVEAENFKQEYTSKLQTVEEEGRQIIKTANQKGETQKQEIVKSAEAEAEKIVNRARIEVQREKEKALEEVKTNIVDLTMLATEKVVGEAITEDRHKALIESFIKEVGEAK